MEPLYSKPYYFSCDVFSNKIDLFKYVMDMLSPNSGLNYLEIGVKDGQSLLWVTENILIHESSLATGIELNPPQNLYKNIKTSQLDHKIKIIPGDSKLILRELNNDTFDLIYIDGHHSAKSVITDTIEAWPLLKEQGFMIFDDYNERPEWPIDQHPKEAIDLFLSAFGDELQLIYRDYLVVVQKKAPVQNSPYYCSIVDDAHLYSWGNQKLFKLSEDGNLRKSIKVSSREIELIEEYFNYKKMGDPTPNPPKDFLYRFDFKKMVERLALKI